MQIKFYKNKKSLIKLLLISTIISYTLFYSPQKNIIVGDNSYNYDELSNDHYPNTSDQEITVITPENKTYTEPMEGYYPATFGFESDSPGEEGTDINFINRYESDHSLAYVKIIDEMNDHKNVMQLYDGTSSGNANFYAYHDFETNREFGTIEFWVLNKDYSGDESGVYYNFGNESGQVYVSFDTFNSLFVLIIDSDNNDLVEFQTGNGLSQWAGLYSEDTWHHIRIDFESTAGGYSGLDQYHLNFWFDGIKKIDNAPMMINDSLGVIATHSHGFDNVRHDYLDAVGYSWDTTYNRGDNLKEGLLLSYENSNDLDWMGYSLDNQANKTILGNTTLNLPPNGIHSIQIFANNTIGNDYESELRYFTVSPINLITPENISYTSAMNGYYPATYGFEDDLDDITGSNIRFIDSDLSGSGCTPIITSNIDGHEKVLELIDISASNKIDIRHTFDTTPTSVTIELYWRSTYVNFITYFDIMNSGSARIRVAIWNNFFQYWDGSYHTVLGITSNTWYHLKIDFECESGGYEGLATDTYYLYIDGTRYGPFSFASAVSDVDGLRISSHDSAIGYSNYIDAIGYSWDSNYNRGDNRNEGILLSFDNSTILDWMGYSFDGQNNITIFGNTTIPFASNGMHNIILTVNDTFGNMFTTPRRYFILASNNPEVSIISPLSNQYFGMGAPSFTTTTQGVNFDKTWYSIDNGITNITIYTSTAIINQIEWDKIPHGLVSLNLYINDTFGRFGYSIVNINKDLNAPTTSIHFTLYDPPNQVLTSTQFTLTSNDNSESGVSTTQYKIDNSAWIPYSGSFTLSTYDSGVYTITYRSIDVVGNTETEKSIEITLYIPPLPPENPNLVPILITSIGIGIGLLIGITLLLLSRMRSNTFRKLSQTDKKISSGSDQFKICPICQTQIKKSDNFCEFCGSPLLNA